MTPIRSLAAFALSLAASLATSLALAAVDVNKASQADLESVKGIGPAMSDRILDARKAGAFADWHDLQSRVKGLGERKALKLSGDGLTVNGAAFKAVSTTPAEPRKEKRPKASAPQRATEKASEKAPQKAAKSPKA